jgi:hypothetical protein
MIFNLNTNTALAAITISIAISIAITGTLVIIGDIAIHDIAISKPVTVALTVGVYGNGYVFIQINPHDNQS